LEVILNQCLYRITPLVHELIEKQERSVDVDWSSAPTDSPPSLYACPLFMTTQTRACKPPWCSWLRLYHGQRP